MLWMPALSYHLTNQPREYQELALKGCTFHSYLHAHNEYPEHEINFELINVMHYAIKIWSECGYCNLSLQKEYIYQIILNTLFSITTMFFLSHSCLTYLPESVQMALKVILQLYKSIEIQAWIFLVLIPNIC